MALWLPSMSMKQRYLIGHVSKVVEDRREKIIIFTTRPLTLFYVECFLANHDYNVLSIRSARPEHPREASGTRAEGGGGCLLQANDSGPSLGNVGEGVSHQSEPAEGLRGCRFCRRAIQRSVEKNARFLAGSSRREKR